MPACGGGTGVRQPERILGLLGAGLYLVFYTAGGKRLREGNGDNTFLYRSMTLVMLATLLSRALGFLREVAIAYRFGTSMETDAYLVAILLPTILFYAFSDALRNTFITVFASFRKDKSAPLFLNTFTLYISTVLALFVLLGVIFAPQVVFLLAPGFGGETLDLAIRLTRILLPGIFFMGLAGIATGFLHSHQRFLIPALVNVPHNLIIICSALFLGAGYGISGLAVGSLLAVASQFFIQVPSLCRVPFPFRPGLAPGHAGLKKIYSLLPAILLSSAVLELKHLLDRLFASFLPAGSIAALNYAERIYVLPQAILGTGIIIVLYPALVEMLAEKDLRSFVHQVRNGVSLLLFALLPVTAGLIMLRIPLIEVFFERGAFDASATETTAGALLYYTPGLVGFALHYFCNRIFFALQEVRVLVWVNLAMVGANALFNFLLMPVLGHGGIALGTSMAFTIGSFWLFLIFARRLALSFQDLLLAPLLRSGLATVFMVAGLYLFFFFWEGFLGRPLGGSGGAGGIILLLSASFWGAVVYFLSAYLLHLPEMKLLQDFLHGVMGKETIYRK
jgi:putative peptidoglycan lipid II flippase